MRCLRDLRLIPVVALAATALFLLKAASIVIEGGDTLIASRAALAKGLGEGIKASDMPPPALLDNATPGTAPVRTDRAPVVRASESPRGAAQQNAGRPAETIAIDSPATAWVRDIYEAPNQRDDSPEYTGSVAAPKPPDTPPANEAPPGGGHGAAPAPDKNISTTPPEPFKPNVSAGERAVLESLQQRRQELDTRARENDVRDSLLKAAEKRIDQRMQELKELESRVQGAEKKKDDEEASKFKSLVTMYENMKAKEAARIFDRLELRVLIEIANSMNPRRMSDILGQMSPDQAEKLTIEIANRSGALGKPRNNGPADLPKIEGRPKS